MELIKINTQKVQNPGVSSFFRQDNGYKDGSYIKVWDGREDNEHLVDVLASTDVNASGYSQLIYTGLKSRYPN